MDEPDDATTGAISVGTPWRRWMRVADATTLAWIVTRPGGAGWFLFHELPAEAEAHEAAVEVALLDIRRRPHPCVARVHDVSRDGGALRWVTDLEPGEALGRSLARALHTRAPFSVAESARRVRDLAAGVTHLRAGAAARAPWDPLVARDGASRMVITDGWRLDVLPVTRIIGGSAFAPAVRMLAPEIVRGAAWSERADVWTLAVVLYECLFAERVIRGETEMDQVASLLGAAAPPRLDAPGRCPPEIVAALRGALSRDPERRTPDVAALVRALEPFSGEGPAEGAVYRTDPRAAIAAAAAAQDLPRAAALLVASPALLDDGFATWLWRALAAPLVDALRDGRCEEPEVVLLTAVRAVARTDLRALREDARARASSHALLDALVDPGAAR